MFHGHIVTPVTPNNSITFSSSLASSSQSLMSLSSPQSTQSMNSLTCTPQSIKSTTGTVILEEERTGTDEEWKVAWCNWAYSRKRGKLAQFIIRNLQMGDYSRWLEPKRGKFEIRDWQTLARIWYSEKERTSEEMDATSIFKKGLSKAFPNLQEVKHMSIKEGTLYKTRVFEAPRELCDEVYKFVKNPRTPAIPLICSHYPNSNSAILEQYHPFQPQHIVNSSIPFSIHPNNNQIFDVNNAFTPLKRDRELNIQQYHQQQQMAPIKIFPRTLPHQMHPGQIIQQQNLFQQQECIQPIQQNGINMIPSNPPTIYTVRESDHVVPGTRFSSDSTSYYSQVDPETSNQPYTQIENDEYVDLPCKPSPGSDLNLAPSPNVHPFEENGSNISSNTYPGTGSSFTHRSPMSHIDSPLLDQKEVEHVIPQQIPEQTHILITDYYDIRITPVHSPIQGGGDLCIVFSQQDNSVPQGEKFLYFDSSIDPHLVPITQDMGYALFTQIPAHVRSETLRIYVILAESRAKIASAEFTYTDSNYSPYTIEVLKGLTSNLVSNEHYKSITGDFSQFHSSQQQQQAPNQFYNHPGYNPMYKMLVLAAGLGIEPLLYVLLQPRTTHNLLLIPSPAGLLAEDYAQKFGHHKISVCLSLVRKQFERTNGVHNDETDEGECETSKHEPKSPFYPKGDPLELINRGGAVPTETTQSIMSYLTKLMEPSQTQSSPLTKQPTPPLSKSASEEVAKKPLTSQKSPPEPISKTESIDDSHERGQTTPKLAHASSSKNLGDSGYGPSFETSLSRDSGDVITGEITLLSGPKYSRKCALGSINSINSHKTDRMLESEAIELINQEMDNLRLSGKPIVLTARGEEFDATLTLEPLQSDLQKVSESGEVRIDKSGESSFTIVGGSETGIFVHSVKNVITHQLSAGDQIFSLNGESFQSLNGFETQSKLASLAPNESFDLTVSENKFLPKARPVVLVGQHAGDLKDKLLEQHSDQFSPFKSEEHFQKSLQKHTHPVIVAQGREELAELSHLHPIVIMCDPRSVLPSRTPQHFFAGSEPTEDMSHSNEFVKLEGTSLEEFRSQAIDAIKREQNSPVWSTVN